jgi:hypothetical protein
MRGRKGEEGNGRGIKVVPVMSVVINRNDLQNTF